MKVSFYFYPITKKPKERVIIKWRYISVYLLIAHTFTGLNRVPPKTLQNRETKYLYYGPIMIFDTLQNF